MSNRFHSLLCTTLTPILVVACISGANLGSNPNGTNGVAGAGGNNAFGGATTAGIGGVGNNTSATGGNRSISTGGANVLGAGGAPITTLGGANTLGGFAAMGGAAATGGAASTTPPPANGLGVYVNSIASDNGKIVFDIRIDNKTTQSVDLSTITLRYWYQDEGLGSTLVFNNDYVKIGYGTTATMSGTAAASPAPVAGADTYIELSFTGTLAAQGNAQTNDQLTLHFTAHTASWAGTVNLLNDYSYMGTVGYDDKITLYAAGSPVWGTEPGTTATPAGAGGSAGVGGSGGLGGASSIDADAGLDGG